MRQATGIFGICDVLIERWLMKHSLKAAASPDTSENGCLSDAHPDSHSLDDRSGRRPGTRLMMPFIEYSNIAYAKRNSASTTIGESPQSDIR